MNIINGNDSMVPQIAESVSSAPPPHQSPPTATMYHSDATSPLNANAINFTSFNVNAASPLSFNVCFFSYFYIQIAPFLYENV